MLFSKKHRLNLEREINELFLPGCSRSATAYPIRMIYRYVEKNEKTPKVRILVSVSKKKFKHAVDRNRAKRQLREAYRQNAFLVQSDKAINIAFVWLSDKPMESSIVSEKMIELLKRLQ